MCPPLHLPIDNDSARTVQACLRCQDLLPALREVSGVRAACDSLSTKHITTKDPAWTVFPGLD